MTYNRLPTMPAAQPSGSARLRLRFIAASTSAVGGAVKVSTPKGRQVSGIANPKGGKLSAAGSAALTATETDDTTIRLRAADGPLATEREVRHDRR